MITVRELIQMLILNCDLGDKVIIEYKEPNTEVFCQLEPRRVYHVAEGEALIECHDE